jgi:hypothetical protein
VTVAEGVGATVIYKESPQFRPGVLHHWLTSRVIKSRAPPDFTAPLTGFPFAAILSALR